MEEMATENAVTGGNETPTPWSTGEKLKEIQAEIKKMGRRIGVGAGVLYIHAFVFRRKKERRQRIALESSQTMTDMKTEKKTDEKSKVLKRKHDDQQETFKEDVKPMTGKNSVNDSAETYALTRSVQKLNQQGKGMSDLKSVSSLQEETETPKHHIEHAIKMMKALHGSSSDDDYAVFKNLKGGFNDHFRDLLRQNGALGSTEAMVDGGKTETNTDCVIQNLARHVMKNLELTFFGSDSDYDTSDALDVKTVKIWEEMGKIMCELFRLYIAEESEKDKMESNGADLKRRKTESITNCDVKSSLEKEEGGQ